MWDNLLQTRKSTVVQQYILGITSFLRDPARQLFVPLDLGSHLKIKCFDGLLVEFVSP
jgi:hypothetical protein